MTTITAIRELIRTEILSTADELRQLKRWWRTPPDARPDRPATRFALELSKRRATLLCMAIAHSRGRIHRRGATAVEQAAQLGEALDAMDRMKVQTALLDARLREAVRAILASWHRSGEPSHECVAPTEERRA